VPFQDGIPDDPGQNTIPKKDLQSWSRVRRLVKHVVKPPETLINTNSFLQENFGLISPG
jgi:hypothetical protein